MLEINNLDIKFERTVLKSVSFKAYPGFIHLIRGESGSGKTSLLYRISLLSNQVDYDYYIDDVSINDMEVHERENLRKNKISISLNNTCLFEELTVLDNIHIYCKNSDVDYHQLMTKLCIDHLYDQKVKELSGGEYQRLSMVCTLVRNKDIIILDEPTSFLDDVNEKEVMLLLKEYARGHNKCIIISSHSQKVIEYSDFIYEIKDKQLNLVLKPESIKYDKNIETLKKSNPCFTVFKYMFKKDMKKLLRIILCLIISYLSIYGISYILEKMQKTSISQVLEVSDNQVFLTSKDMDIYAKDNDEYIDHTLNLKTRHVIYPYNNLYFMVDDVRVDVLPLFKENNIQDQLETQYSIAENGVILSKNTNQLFFKYQKQSRLFVENIMNGNDIFTYEASIKGILKEGINNYFTNNKYFIYIPYDYLPHNHSEYTGYVLFSETIDDYNKLIEELNSYEIDINTEFINYENLNKVIDNIKRIKITLYVLSSLATISFCGYLFYHYYNNRNKDYISLLISGMTFKDLKKYFIFEIISIFLITFSMIMPLSLIMLMGGYIEIIDLAIIFAVIIISCILSLVLSTFNLHNLSVEDLLRN